jgi:hypothetical protein
MQRLLVQRKLRDAERKSREEKEVVERKRRIVEEGDRPPNSRLDTEGEVYTSIRVTMGACRLLQVQCDDFTQQCTAVMAAEIDKLQRLAQLLPAVHHIFQKRYLRVMDISDMYAIVTHGIGDLEVSDPHGLRHEPTTTPFDPSDATQISALRSAYIPDVDAGTDFADILARFGDEDVVGS